MRKIKKAQDISHQSLALQLLRPTFCAGNECLPPRQDRARSLTLLACLKVHDQLRRVATGASSSAKHPATNDVPAAMRNLKGKEKMAYYRALVIEELRNMGVANPEAPLKAKGTVGAEILDNVVPGFFAALQLDDGTDGGEIAKLRVCPAQVSVIGGMMAQEAIKAITHLHMPISQFFVQHNAVGDGREESWIQRKSRKHVEMWEYSRLTREQLPYPVDVVRELRSLRVFVVGAGAIGCELLKNFAQMGVGVDRSGSTEDNFEEQQAVDVKVTPNNQEKKRSSLWERNGLQRGGIVVTDMDVIERSNLNRQLLFREKHIGQPKATVAASQVAGINPEMEGRVCGLTLKISADTENVFDTAFWEDADIVVTALDNVDARKYVDELCVLHGKWLIDSGTLGTKGNTQVVIPHLTESYSSSADPEEAAIPLCTIKTFPYQPEHCVAWAKNKFEEYFVVQPQLHAQLQGIAQQHRDNDRVQWGEKINAWLLGLTDEQVTHMADVIKFLPGTEASALLWAEEKFEQLFAAEVGILLAEHPADSVDEDGQPFWGRSRRLPHQLTYDGSDPTHRAFVQFLAVVRLRVLGAQSVAEHHADTLRFSTTPAASNRADLRDAVLRSIEANAAYWGNLKPRAEEFDKDAFALGHVEVVAALTNLRCRVYGIKEIDTLQVQKIAGNIIPALATTTSVVAGLVAEEVVKFAAERARHRREISQAERKKGRKVLQRKGVHRPAIISLTALPGRWLRALRKSVEPEASNTGAQRPRQVVGTTGTALLDKEYLVKNKDRLLGTFANSFINLARPMMASARPQEAERFTFSGQEYTLWDSIQVPGSIKDLTVEDVCAYLSENFAVTVDSVSWGDTLLYAAFIPEHAQLRSRPIREVMLRALAVDRSPGLALGELKAQLRGKRTVMLQVTATGDTEDGDVRVPPLKISAQ